MAIYERIRLFRLPDTFVKRSLFNLLLTSCLSFTLLAPQSIAIADSQIEYRVKAAFIYNFIAFTQWPDNSDRTINFCVYGENYFGDEINKLQSKPVNNHHIRVEHIYNPEELKDCQAIFFSKSVKNNLSSILKNLQNKPILTLADNPDAISQNVIINMDVVNEKIVFEINLGAARRSGLDLSSKLLQLAAKVY